MDPQDDEAQRTMEKHALRNVRGLVDNLEKSEAAARLLQKRLIFGFVAVLVVLGLLAAAGVIPLGGGQKGELVVKPAAPAR